MHALRIGIGIVWALFWIGWLGVAFTANRSTNRRFFMGPRGVAAVALVILLRGVHGGSLEVRSMLVAAIGAVLFAAGIALAVWARAILGRNWGMPMTQRAEPELVTAGPYGLIRHPIYSGILLGMVGTSLATNLIGLGITLVLGIFFVYSAIVEERNLTATFPSAYPAYRERTKMLIPYLL
ncbi:MAG TPA: isoprenylcysteine carboxylmethyltransferase family protein [Solirubrobacteraceae bacterium]|jgi:protein-S-isoprenylcysteine O-methyltransferase Ste14|nr:isoprenylcysteine carboxylmethyltransferase family protein [Solirubrobacteraceae bacterium]